VSYREFAPPPELAASVACLWVREVAATGTQLVVPDGCIDIVALPGGVVTAGPDTGPARTAVAAGQTIVGVRFRPGAAPPILGWPANELRDRRVPLDDLWGPAGRMPPSLPALVDAVARRLRYATTPDALVRAAIAELARGRPVAELPARLHLGDRQLRRRFHAAVGYGPKVYARVLRLQRMLALAREAPEAAHGGLARLAADAGYADHAHMAGETARLTGLAPRALLLDRFPQAPPALAA
jgi:AraC-like DNA-binding protein